MEQRLIDANVLLAAIRPDDDEDTKSAVLMSDVKKLFRNAIANAPTIDPESLRPKGIWIGEADGYADGWPVYDVWNCSECNHCIDDGTDDPELLPNYCPNCGAKMEGK